MLGTEWAQIIRVMMLLTLVHMKGLGTTLTVGMTPRCSEDRVVRV